MKNPSSKTLQSQPQTFIVFYVLRSTCLRSGVPASLGLWVLGKTPALVVAERCREPAWCKGRVSFFKRGGYCFLLCKLCLRSEGRAQCGNPSRTGPGGPRLRVAMATGCRAPRGACRAGGGARRLGEPLRGCQAGRRSPLVGACVLAFVLRQRGWRLASNRRWHEAVVAGRCGTALCFSLQVEREQRGPV